MPTYYETLQVDLSAPTGVIEAALDTRYNEWRRLVNHPDPDVVSQANAALHQLETMRATLTDPVKRREYDASISFAGLADPEAVLKAASNMPPPLPMTGSTAMDSSSSAWSCPQCGHKNDKGSKVCTQCGQPLGRECPDGCGNIVQLGERFCAKCGASIQDGLARLQAEWEQAQQKRIRMLRDEISKQRAQNLRLNELRGSMSWIGGPRKEIERLVNHSLPTKTGWSFRRLAAVLSAALVAVVLAPVFIVTEGGAASWLFCWAFFWTILVPVVAWLQFRLYTRKEWQGLIDSTSRLLMERINSLERQINKEQANQFDPISPRPYSSE